MSEVPLCGRLNARAVFRDRVGVPGGPNLPRLKKMWTKRVGMVAVGGRVTGDVRSCLKYIPPSERFPAHGRLNARAVFRDRVWVPGGAGRRRALAGA